MREGFVCEELCIAHRGRAVRGFVLFPASAGEGAARAESCRKGAEGATPAAKGRPAAVFCHGFGGRAEDFEGAAAFLARNGVVACCFTFCGSSPAAEEGLSTREMTLWTEREDLLAVLAHLRADARVDGERLFLCGASQGGMVSALAACAGAVRGMVLLYPAFCIPDDWRRAFPRAEDVPDVHTLWGVELGRPFFETAKKIDVFAEACRFAGPVLLLHGDADAVVPVSYSRRAAEIFPQAVLAEFAGEGHGFSPTYAEKADQMLLAFVQKYGA